MTPAENDASDIGELAMIAYRAGANPLWFAESMIAELASLHSMVAIARLDDPDAYLAYGANVGPMGLARRILGELLDAGWAPPVIRKAAE